MKAFVFLLVTTAVSAGPVAQLPSVARFVQRIMQGGELPADYSPPNMQAMPAMQQMQPMQAASAAPLHTPSKPLASKQFLETVHGVPGSIRVKKRYGPYILPSSQKVTLLSQLTKDQGMLDSVKFVDAPCRNCTVLFANISMEYADGSEANIDSGSWMHHSILLATGKSKRFLGCGYPQMPGAEPFIAGGNERTPIAFTSWDGLQKSGYYIGTKDKFVYYNELMNLDVAEKEVYVTVTTEYLRGRQPDFTQTEVVWLDLNFCSPFGSKPPPGNVTRFTSSKGQKWVAPFGGNIVNLFGHLHTGGTNVKVYKNDKLLCNTPAAYGETPRYVEKSTGIQGATGMTHISKITGCTALGRFEEGDVFYLTADYDFVEHPGMMTTEGKVDEIMGLSAIYITPDKPKHRA